VDFSFTRSGLRRFAVLLGAMSALMLAVAVANHTDGLIGGSAWTYIALAGAGVGAVAAAANLALSRAIDEEGEFLRRADEPSAAPLKRGFPLWLHLPLTAFVAVLFVLVGVGLVGGSPGSSLALSSSPTYLPSYPSSRSL
jgi:hypothetical protein